MWLNRGYLFKSLIQDPQYLFDILVNEETLRKRKKKLESFKLTTKI